MIDTVSHAQTAKWVCASLIAVFAFATAYFERLKERLVSRDAALSATRQQETADRQAEAARLAQATLNDLAAKAENAEKEGLLIPDNKPTPPHFNRLPGDDFVVFLGRNGFPVAEAEFPKTIIGQGGESMLSVGREANGFWVDAKFFNKEGKIVAELIKNRFHINSNSVFRIERTAHRLTVFNDEGRMTADIEFLNPSTMTIVGSFFLRDRKELIYTHEGVSMRSHQ